MNFVFKQKDMEFKFQLNDFWISIFYDDIEVARIDLEHVEDYRNTEYGAIRSLELSNKDAKYLLFDKKVKFSPRDCHTSIMVINNAKY